MPVGIEMWLPNGAKIVDTTTNIAAIIGQNSGTGSFTVTNDDFTKGVPWYFYIPRGVYSFTNPAGGIPQVSFSGNTMTVTGSGIDGVIIYGVS